MLSSNYFKLTLFKWQIFQTQHSYNLLSRNGKLQCNKYGVFKSYVIITTKPDTAGLGLVCKAEAVLQSEAHRLYGFNYSLRYKNNLVSTRSTCISPTLCQK